jgi:hypothetical protein
MWGGVFLVGYVLQPDDLDVVFVGFLKGEVNHCVGGGRAVPVEFVGEDGDRVTWADDSRGLTVELYESYAGEDVQGLADGMGVPGGAGSWGEGDA